MSGWLARKVKSSYSRCVSSMGLPFLKTWKLSVLIVRAPPALMPLSAAVPETIAVRRMFAFTRAISSRMEKGLVM